jgi:hypothetical protein
MHGDAGGLTYGYAMSDILAVIDATRLYEVATLNGSTLLNPVPLSNTGWMRTRFSYAYNY